MASLFVRILFRLIHPRVVLIMGQYRIPTLAALIAIFGRRRTIAYVNVPEDGGGAKFLPSLMRFPRLMFISVTPAHIEGYSFLEPRLLKKYVSGIVLVLTGAVDTPYGVEVFASEKETVAPYMPFVNILGSRDALVVLDDDVTFRETREGRNVSSRTFGFHEDADIFISNPFLLTDERFLKKETGEAIILNAKLNTRKQSVPIWLKNSAGRAHLYGVAAAVACISALDEKKFSILEISEALKQYHPPRGFFHASGGKNNTIILDDTADATLFSMFEAIEILGQFASRTRIAVLGDLVGLQEAESAMRNIARGAIKNCDIFIAVGTQSSIAADEASARGFPRENLHAFQDAKEAAKFLRSALKGGEVILIDGAKELYMEEVVKALV